MTYTVTPEYTALLSRQQRFSANRYRNMTVSLLSLALLDLIGAAVMMHVSASEIGKVVGLVLLLAVMTALLVRVGWLRYVQEMERCEREDCSTLGWMEGGDS